MNNCNLFIGLKHIEYFLSILLFCFLASCQKDEGYPAIEIKASVQHVSEFGSDDGMIDLDVNGGAPPLSFLWSNNDTTEDLVNVSAGVYSVIINDNENQTATDSFEIMQPAPDTLTVVIQATHPSETGAVDGTITVQVGGGYPPYDFSWSNGASTKNLEGLPAASYILTINDSRGQVLTDTVQLTDVVTDVDGNTYSIVKIGEQTWMGENLRVRHAPDGACIESYAYNNDTTFELKYGRLYSWNAAMNGSSEEKAQGICPCGWHIPTDDEFKQLEIFLGMTENEADMTNTWRGSPVGKKLRVGESSGYNAQMAGRRASSGTYSVLGQWEYMWTSSTHGTNYAWRRCLALSRNSVGRYNTFPKSYGFSIRCLKNEE